LFPNPNNGQFTINISDEENTQINITNVLGQIILSQKGESITKIDLSKSIIQYLRLSQFDLSKLKYLHLKCKHLKLNNLSLKY
jgi:hypothetical protein